MKLFNPIRNKFSLLLSIMFISIGSLAATKPVLFKVEHMDCVTCAVVVKSALSNLNGVESIVISTEDKTVEVVFDEQKLTPSKIAETLTQTGFPAKVSKNTTTTIKE